MGLDPETSELFADLNLVFIDGVLYCKREFQDRPDLIALIVTTILSALDWSPFIQARWLTVGDTLRTLVIAVLIGFDFSLRESLRPLKRVAPLICPLFFLLFFFCFSFLFPKKCFRALLALAAGCFRTSSVFCSLR